MGIWQRIGQAIVSHSRCAPRRNRWPARCCSLTVRGGETLETRTVFAAIEMTPGEQLLLELVNRARANPAAEAARYKVDLNDQLDPGSITEAPKQPLAPHPALVAAARFHSREMLDGDFFEHVNPKTGDGPTERALEFGYPNGAGENIAWYGTPYRLDRDGEVYKRHEALFLSAHHRVNILEPSYRELGNGIEFGVYDRLSSIMVTENFGSRGGNLFITGVAYTDQVAKDNFYTIGEQLGGVTIVATRVRDGAEFTTVTAVAGGYSLQVPAGTYTVRAVGGPLAVPISVEHVTMGKVNMKVDFNARTNGLASIAGIVFDDRNSDGVQDAGETGLANRVLFLDANNNGKRDAEESTVATNSAGQFLVSHIIAGTYRIQQDPVPGWNVTTKGGESVTVTVSSDEAKSGLVLATHLDNAQPIAVADNYAVVTGQASPLDVYANDRDPDGTLKLTETKIYVSPQHGTVTLDQNQGKLIYRSTANYVGTDSFEYSVPDAKGLQSNRVVVSLTVGAASTARWRNPKNQLDVSNDTFVSPFDALLILNTLNELGGRSLVGVANGGPPYWDVTGDDYVSPLDALMVLNELNTRAASAAVVAVAAHRAESFDERSIGAQEATDVREVRPTGDELAAAVDSIFSSQHRSPKAGFLSRLG